MGVAAIATAIAAGVALWLSFGTLAFTDATAGRRIGLLPAPWLLAPSIGAGFAFVAAARRAPHWRRPLYLSFLILLPWLPFPIPDAFLIWSGPIRVIVWSGVAICLVATLFRRSGSDGFTAFSDPRLAPRVAGALAFVALLAVRYAQVLPPVGDEPHYLIVAQSLLADRDLTVANNYERGDYSRYYGGALSPHYARPALDGSQYSFHAPGLPVMIAPAFAIGGYPAVVAWIAAIAALGTVFVWKAAHALTGDAMSAWFAWATAALTAPMILEGTLVYPDAVAGTILAAGVLAILTAASISFPAALGTGFAIGLLPWLHTRLAIPAGLLTALLLLRIAGNTGGWRTGWRLAIALAVPVAASVGVWFVFFYRLYGSFSPSAQYYDRIPLQMERIVTGVIGMIADQEFGLLPNAPVHVLWLAGVWTLFRMNRRLAAEIVLVTVPYAIALGGFEAWWGGSTPARYLAPLVFPLAMTVAPLWSRQDAFGRATSAALLVISVLMAAAFGFGHNGSLAYNLGEGRAALLDWVSPLVNLPAGLPSYFRAIPATGPARGSVYRELVIPGLLWTATLAATWMAARALYRKYPGRVSAPVLATLCLVVASGVGVTTTWASGTRPHLTATRAQLELVARENPGARPLAVQFVPFRFMPSGEALRRLTISTSHLEPAPRGALLFLGEVPPGDYRLRFTLRSAPRGDIGLSIGRATRPVAEWRLSAPEQPFSFTVPMHAAAITVSGDAEAAQSIEELMLVPVRHITTPWAAGSRARDAARYGRHVVYAIDNRIVLEPDGFWVLGGRQPDVPITFDEAASALTLEVTNVAIVNRVRVSAGAWSETRDLDPDARWRVTIPIADSTRPAVVNFRVEQGVRIGGEVLGCRVTVIN